MWVYCALDLFITKFYSSHRHIICPCWDIGQLNLPTCGFVTILFFCICFSQVRKKQETGMCIFSSLFCIPLSTCVCISRYIVINNLVIYWETIHIMADSELASLCMLARLLYISSSASGFDQKIKISFSLELFFFVFFFNAQDNFFLHQI